MTTNPSHIREGFAALRPYLFVHPDMVDFVQTVFSAEVTASYETPMGAHVEIKIEDSYLILETAERFPDSLTVTTTNLYVYVPNVDEVYEKAMAAGAESISAPEDKPYDERQCGIIDPTGNTWWISTYIHP